VGQIYPGVDKLAGYVAPKRKAIAFDTSEEYRASMPTRIEIVAGNFPDEAETLSE